MLTILRKEASKYAVKLDESQHHQFERYVALLGDWNQRANLVSDAAPEIIQRRHILESLALGAALREREVLRPDSRVIDVGAGAGFPGLPIKIAWPQIHLTLLEATAKKTAFLSALVDDLRLPDIQVLTGRAEDLAHDPSLREHFDLVLARAVAPLPVLLELTLPFARINGRVVTPKGSRADEEITAASGAASRLHAKVFVVPFAVPGPEQKLVAAVKLGSTPHEYPRRPGVPARSPL
jgi:16S rRNA (guanine527-N7)-methyltransferase